MPATDSILSISLYVCSLMQSFIWAYYMPAYMPSIHYAKSYVFAYINLYICYRAIVSMSVNISSSVSVYMPNALSRMLYVICRLSYAKARMLVYICWMPCASCCQFTVKLAYMPISVPVFACSVTDLTCQLQYTCIYMPAHDTTRNVLTSDHLIVTTEKLVIDLWPTRIKWS
jgi:hypothetical protein